MNWLDSNYGHFTSNRKAESLTNITIFAVLNCAMKNILYSGFLFVLTVSATAQGDIQTEKLLMSQASIHVGYYLNGSDFADRYLSPAIIGAGYHIKTKGNLLFGVDGGYVFRDGIKDRENYLLNMQTNNGEIIAQDGGYAQILFGLRGFVINGSVGKIFPIFGPNPNSGLLVKLGGGFMQHKIHFESRRDDVPQLEGDMRKYYDQMAYGWSLNQFVGYQNLSNSRLTNFYIGIETIQGFTKNRRDYNIDLGGPDNALRTDLLFGIKVGWMVLLYKRKPKEFYFN